MSKWTFGIITAGGEEANVNISKAILSIYDQNIPLDSYEIIIVGGEPCDGPNIKYIPFDETQKKAWITKKKNIIAREASFPNLCLMHDYVILKDGWYKGFEEFGYDWSHCMNPIANKDGIRFRDWVTWLTPPGVHPNKDTIRFLNYDDQSMVKKQYISGTYYCVKKSWALQQPLDERKSWGQSEDVKWSMECRDRWNYRCNPNSMVQFLKQKDPHPIINKRLCEAIGD